MVGGGGCVLVGVNFCVWVCEFVVVVCGWFFVLLILNFLMYDVVVCGWC